MPGVTWLRAAALLGLATTVLAAGCGDDQPSGSGSDPAEESSETPAKPPSGWRTVRNERAGFTVSAPHTWSASTKGPATLIRSDDELVSITVAADRTAGARGRNPGAFARATIENLPGFRGRVPERTRPVGGSPYKTARVDARGRVETSKLPQRITAAVYQRPGLVTFAVLVFRNAKVKPRFNDPVVERLLHSFRAQAPDFTP